MRLHSPCTPRASLVELLPKMTAVTHVYTGPCMTAGAGQGGSGQALPGRFVVAATPRPSYLPHGLIPCSLHVTCPWATSSLVTVSRQGFDSHAGGFWCHMGVGMSRGVIGGIINGSPGSR